MKPTIICWTRTLPLAIGTLAFFAACTNAPMSQSTSEYAASVAPSVVGAAATKLPVVLPGNVQPVYPKTLLRDGVAGLVTIDCVVDEAGHVMVATIEKTSHPAFAKPALDAVRQWNFQPGTRDGVPVAMHVTVPVSFALGR